MNARTVSIAPRGKVFKLVRMNHVAGGKVLPVLMPGRWLTRSDAESAATKVDARLQPTVILVDDIKVEEVRS